MEKLMGKKRFQVMRNFNRTILNPIVRKLIERRIIDHPLIYHVGRQSGKCYSTPAQAITKDGYIYIPMTYGPDSDWYLNIKAAGSCRVLIHGKEYSAKDPEQVDARGAEAAFPNNVNAPIRINNFLRLSVGKES
jgi:deazaflavin-dependent oxidoreductase (nitroreductase family)